MSLLDNVRGVKTRMHPIQENLAPDSPLAMDRHLKRLALLIFAMDKPGITADRRQSLEDEVQSRAYNLRKAGYSIPRRIDDMLPVINQIALDRSSK